MTNHNSFNRNRYYCLLSVLSISVFFCVFSNSAKAQNVITDFSPTNFTVVNQTAVPLNNYTNSFDTNVGGNSNRYRLTDTFDYQIRAIWYNQNIDLSEDFVINFTLSYGDGKRLDPIIGAGCSFVFTTQNPHNSLIGGNYTNCDLLSNSFGIRL